MINTKSDMRKGSLLEETFDMLRKLNLQELEIVQSVIKSIASKDDNYYQPLSEAESFLGSMKQLRRSMRVFPMMRKKLKRKLSGSLGCEIL